jgi:hypothetical protein
MKTNTLRKVYKGGYRVYFVYARSQNAALLDEAISRSGLSASAFFLKAGKLLARVQTRTEQVGLAEAARILAK